MKRLLRFKTDGGNKENGNELKSREFEGRSDSESSSSGENEEKNPLLLFPMGDFSMSDLGELEDPRPASTRREDEILKMIPHPGKLIPIFEEGVRAKDNRYHLRVYRDCFVASDAVDFLVQHLGVTRKQAVVIGRILQRDYHLFEHVEKDHLFWDAYLFFRYLPPHLRSAPIDPLKAKTMVLSEIADAMEKGVVSLNRQYRLKTFKDTFLGSEAVDFLCNNGFADSRRCAVNLGRLLFKETHLFEHCAKEKSFEDDDFFYRFIDKSRRQQLSPNATKLTAAEALLRLHNNDTLLDAANALEDGVSIKDQVWRTKRYKDVFVASEAVSFIVNSSLADTRKDAVHLCRRMKDELNLFHHVNSTKEFSDDYLLFQFTDEYDRRYPGQAPSTASITADQLQDIAESIRQKLEVKKRRYHARMYPNTFVASELVDYLFHNGYAESRRQAVKLGRRLASQLNLFKHVTGDHELRDEYLFFRFCDNSAKDIETAIDNASCSLEDMARAFRQGVQVSTHTFRLQTLKGTFLGSEGVDFLEGLCKNRKDALLIGRKIQSDYNLFSHVKHKNELEDSTSLYRFNKDDEISGGLSLVEVNMGTSDLRQAAKALEAHIELKDNKFHMRVYKNTFIARDAVDFLADYSSKSRSEAVQIGRLLAVKFHLFEHVTNQHDFSDEAHFFRFVKPSLRTLWAEEDILKDVTQAGEARDESELTEEERWQRNAMAFEAKVKKKEKQRRHLATCTRRTLGSTTADIPSDLLPSVSGSDDPRKALLHAYVMMWMSSFRRTDPRFQILKYFTEVSQEGADEIEAKGVNAECIRILSKYFYRASVFTVWRPTSFEAIKKMMLGTAVGKGLDIKGKSAKRGALSAFVPLLQISENRHKQVVKKLPSDATIRLFFSGDARDDRDAVAVKLEAIAEEMIQTVEEAQEILAGKNIDEAKRKDARSSLSLDMADPSISYIDDYAPYVFGIEIPSRLFWEAYIVRQDITREPGSIYDTGRPSQPAFQDMNFAALHAAPKPAAPRAVLYQHASAGNPMNPFELLMAYEENESVKPVVSDFDCFLVGTRGVSYKKPLPEDQLDIMQWCVNEIQTILDGPVKEESWTSRWLEILKIAASKGFHPEFPRFGFGDPKSYGIMEHAVGRLETEGGGAVRHGAECFNFYFPQELDDEFLVISENIADSNVPWKYMGVGELQSFLDRQINFGYTFPLNVKWILCDPGWKSIYDKLLASKKPNVQDSLDVWYPGPLRDKIENISIRNPNGFRRKVKSELETDTCLRQSGTGAMDLALEELTSAHSNRGSIDARPAV